MKEGLQGGFKGLKGGLKGFKRGCKGLKGFEGYNERGGLQALGVEGASKPSALKPPSS